jgi:magnesium chelatase subunit D
VGTRQGRPRGGARLDVVESLRAAAPWQRVRLADRPPRTANDGPRAPLEMRVEDLRVQRRVRRTGTTTLFVVDASGSAALGRLAEAKGAVELLLGESYVRRDRVGLLAFKGTTSEQLLPPTRALTRARRALAGLPAGGGTPLATALLAAAETVDAVRRDGSRAAVVLLTDGRANVALDGAPGRPQARADAHAAARALRAREALVVLVDTSPRGDAEARALAAALDARYVALPVVTARALHERVRTLVGEVADAPAGRRA